MNLRSLLRSFLLLLLSGALLFSLSACSKYRVEMSNTEQTRTMLTVGETEIAYEVVYFFYHTYLDAYPEESFATRMERVNKGICEL